MFVGKRIVRLNMPFFFSIKERRLSLYHGICVSLDPNIAALLPIRGELYNESRTLGIRGRLLL